MIEREDVERMGINNILQGLSLALNASLQQKDISKLREVLQELKQSLPFVLEGARLTNLMTRWKLKHTCKSTSKLLGSLEAKLKSYTTFDEFIKNLKN